MGQAWGLRNPNMQRFIARVVVVLMLVGVFAPAALAAAAPAAHACCMRKPMHEAAPNQAAFGVRYCGHHECCRSLAVSQWAEPSPAGAQYSWQQSTTLDPEWKVIYRTAELLGSHFVRGPPVVS